jgi:hypothetical protein
MNVGFAQLLAEFVLLRPQKYPVCLKVSYKAHLLFN